VGWIIDLRSGRSVEDVVTEIMSSETEKHFGDYWWQGDWGEKEGAALK